MLYGFLGFTRAIHCFGSRWQEMGGTAAVCFIAICHTQHVWANFGNALLLSLRNCRSCTFNSLALSMPYLVKFAFYGKVIVYSKYLAYHYVDIG
jgi:hypothetical protein